MTTPEPCDLASFPAPHLAVDVVILTIVDGDLKVLLLPRSCEPFAGQLVLPGGFVRPQETLEATAAWVLADKAHLPGLALEQLFTFSEPNRDPRGWVVSAAHFALVPAERLRTAFKKQPDLALATISVATGDKVTLTIDDAPITPGFDHAVIIATALERLRGKLDWSMLAFELLSERFTLYDIQRTHEVILGRTLNKPHFRKRMLEGRRLVATGEFARGRHRPAELYQLEESRP
jgi:8-oxo-dGTP diphosphatase